MLQLSGRIGSIQCFLLKIAKNLDNIWGVKAWNAVKRIYLLKIADFAEFGKTTGISHQQG
jgi:hypothetical protein